MDAVSSSVSIRAFGFLLDTWAQSDESLPQIRVPFLAINAADDPIVVHNPTEETQHSVTCALVITERGGHLGWFTGGWNPFSRTPPDRWVRRPILEFIRAVAEDYVPDTDADADTCIGPLPKDNDGTAEISGFIMALGKDLVGFKVIEEGQIIHGEDLGPTRSGVLGAGL